MECEGSAQGTTADTMLHNIYHGITALPGVRLLIPLRNFMNYLVYMDWTKQIIFEIGRRLRKNKSLKIIESDVSYK